MIASIKYLLGFILLWVPFCAFTQVPLPPAQVSATYKKYTNRIELSWSATAKEDRYIIKRRELTQQNLIVIDTVPQNRYVDRNKLKANTDYLYCIQALTQAGITSAPSVEAKGSLLVVAGGHTAIQDSVTLSDCVEFTLVEAKATTRFWTLKFLARKTCSAIENVACTLYHSTDNLLDENDTLLLEKSFNLSRTRGAMTAPNDTSKRTGYLLLKVAWNDQFFVQEKAIAPK